MTAVPLALGMRVDARSGRPAPTSRSAPPVEPADILQGFDEIHREIGAIAERLQQVSATTAALVETLVAAGLIARSELESQRVPALERERSDLEDAGVLVQLWPAPDRDGPDADTSTVSIDCADRIELCHAACCRFRFALSAQDVEAGVVQWEIAAPYVIRHGTDGYCVHCDATSGACGVYEHRPAVCRRFDCREDTRIWQDFDRRIPNPALAQTFSA